MTPLVSVILPVYNRVRWVARAISSVLHQTYPAIELIVVDDGSDDGTRHVLHQFASRITHLSQDHAGAYAARNLALSRARGELIAFIDSDDLWSPDRLSRQVPLLERPAVGLVFGDAVHVVGGPGATTRTRRTCFGVTPPARGRVAAHFAWGNFVPTSTVLVRRRCFEECGAFTTSAAVSADYLKWFQIALHHDFEYDPHVLAQYTVHADGISHDVGRSLRARLQLFSDELARTNDSATREVLRRLLFNVSLHLAWAALRGKVTTPAETRRLVWRTASAAGGMDAPAWTTAFAVRHLRMRGRRFVRSRHMAGL
jgi:glycosyltransferase involved in cell wall biosynthesis